MKFKRQSKRGVIRWYNRQGVMTEEATIIITSLVPSSASHLESGHVKLGRVFSPTEKRELKIDRSTVPIIFDKMVSGNPQGEKRASPEYLARELERAKADADRKRAEPVVP